jgi:thioredoxin-dependent peroxiredoxin
MGAIEVGDVAPDFVLPGMRLIDGRAEHADYRLSDHRGSPIVLAFYPLDGSKVCTDQLCSYQDQFEGFDALGAQIWGISLQGVESHEEFARAEGLTFPLLGDHRDGVGAAYGTMLGPNAIRRSVFLIDADGIVRWKHVAFVGFTYRKAGEIREQILKLYPEPAGGMFSLAPPA